MSLALTDLIGNKKISTQLTVTHGAATLNNRAMGHMLFSGLAGCGKTSMSKAVAGLSGLPFFEATPEAIRSAEDLAKIFGRFPAEGYYVSTGEKIGTIYPPILFIDEAHRLTRRAEEILGIAMENLSLTYMEGRGKNKRATTVWVPEFTVICATTKEGELTKPFRDRFKFIFVFDSYSFEESIQIILLHAKRKHITIDSASVEAIARRGRGIPRLLVRYLDNIHDNMVFLTRKTIKIDLTEAQFQLAGIDTIGLTDVDIVILKDLYESSGPKGIDSLAVKTNLDPRTIMEVNEPYMIRLGFLERSKGGRVITEAGENYLIKMGHVAPPQSEPSSSRVLKRVKCT